MQFDWIDEYMSLTETFRTAEPFRLWSGIATLSMILERSAYTVSDGIDPLYPNQYIILAGNPASGKTQMVSLAKRMLSPLAADPLQGVYLGPDNPTKASFLQEFERATRLPSPNRNVPTHSAIAMLCMEFGVLLSRYETDFIADLTTIYDNPPLYIAPRKSVEGVKIDGPTLNILAAATPGALADTIPESAWTQGFTSRFLFIYGDKPSTYRDMFRPPRRNDITVLQDILREYHNEVVGEFIWDPDAQDANRHWFNEEAQHPVPKYGRLATYVDRRNEHVMKLAMVSAVSAGHGLSVALSDFRRAQRWLFTAEKYMPDVFHAMHQKSDQQIMADAHQWMYTIWSIPKLEDRKAIKERKLLRWFEGRAPSEKVEGFIKMMEKTGRIRREGITGEWIPNTFDKFNDM